MTPREFSALQERHLAREKMLNVRAGLMPSIYVNAHSRKGAKKRQPLDFFERSRDVATTAPEIGAKLTELFMFMKARREGK